MSNRKGRGSVRPARQHPPSPVCLCGHDKDEHDGHLRTGMCQRYDCLCEYFALKET